MEPLFEFAPPLGPPLLPLSVTLSFSFFCPSLHLCQLFQRCTTWFSVWTWSVFMRAIPLIPFPPLLSRSFHLQQSVLSISSSFSDPVQGLPLACFVTPWAYSHHLNSLLYPHPSMLLLWSLCHILSLCIDQPIVNTVGVKATKFSLTAEWSFWLWCGTDKRQARLLNYSWVKVNSCHAVK